MPERPNREENPAGKQRAFRNRLRHRVEDDIYTLNRLRVLLQRLQSAAATLNGATATVAVAPAEEPETTLEALVAALEQQAVQHGES